MNHLKIKKNLMYGIGLAILSLLIVGLLYKFYSIYGQIRRGKEVFSYQAERLGDITRLPKDAIERDYVVIASDSMTGNVDPRTAAAGGDKLASRMIFEPLIRIGSDLAPEPWLAKRWEISDDGRTYTFYIRDDIRFSNGKELTLEDIQASYTAFCNLPRMSEYDQWINFLEGYHAYLEGNSTQISGIKVYEDRISFTFVRSHFSNIWTFLIPILNAEAVKDRASMDTVHSIHDSNIAIGTGPYAFHGMQDGQMELVRNWNYRGGIPKIETIIITNSNSNLIAEELRKGMVDLYSFKDAHSVLSDAKGIPYINVYSYEGSVTGYLGVNCRNPILKETAVRQAIAYGINREQIVREELYGTSFLPLSVYFDHSYIMPKNYNSYAYDREEAVRILEENGYRLNDGGIREKDGMQMEFELAVNDASAYYEVSKRIADDLSELGIVISINAMNANELENTVYEKKNYDLYYGFFNNNIEPPFASIFLEKEGSNTEGWWNEEAAKYLKEAESSCSLEERSRWYRKWMERYNQELPQIPINSIKYYTISSAKVSHVEPCGMQNPYAGVQSYEFVE